MSMTRPSLTVTDRLHESGQSSGHAVRTDARGSRPIASISDICEVYTTGPTHPASSRDVACMPDDAPHIVIIGGGFGGLAAAQALKRAPVRLTLLDRRNHHL